MSNINNGVLDGVRRIAAKVRSLAVDGTAPGAPLGMRLMGASTSGAPKTGTWKAGDRADDRYGNAYICTAGGTGPGATWVSVSSAYALAAAQSGGMTGLGYVGAMCSVASGVAPTAPTTQWTSGALWGQLMFVLPGVTVNGYVTLAPWGGGGALAGTYIALYNSSGTQLGITADLSAQSTSGDGIRVAVTGFTATPSDGKIYMLYTNGTQSSGLGPYYLPGEAFSKGYPGGVSGLASNVSVMAFTEAGPTTMPASLTFGANGIPTGFSASSPLFYQAFLD